ncbi:CoA ester lyase [Microbulbifer sp. MKSA007]|nr:CoA ester lyase [Microbulbifer sp. MKSA007]
MSDKMNNLKLFPALLFTPGNQPERFAKASEVGANGIIIDLEDSVPVEDKDSARDIAIDFYSRPSSNGVISAIRINSLSTINGIKDMAEIIDKKPFIDVVLYPKTESQHDINLISELLSEAYKDISIIALIETAQGASNLYDIVNCSSEKLQGLMFGAADYAADLNCECTPQALIWARMKLVEAAALKQIACYDSPCFNFKDEGGLINELNEAQSLGFSGKAAIHPKQVKTIKISFRPTLDQYKEAKEIVRIYNESSGKACQYEGRMIDIPIYSKAQQIISNFNNLS